MNQIEITTSQNVKINFRLASIGERILAFFIDLLILVAYIVVINILLQKVFHVQEYFSGLDQFSIIAILGIIFLPVLTYALITESLMEGQTLGKKLIGIKTIKIDGYQCSFADYLTRWFFRSPEIFATSGVVALLSTIFSKNNQRLGDMASGTAVISLKNNVNISHTILENLQEDYLPVFPAVIAFSDNDIRIIKENFLKASRTGDHIIIHRLVEKMKEILKLDNIPQEYNEKQFIDKVLKDYNFYTGKEV